MALACCHVKTCMMAICVQVGFLCAFQVQLMHASDDSFLVVCVCVKGLNMH